MWHDGRALLADRLALAQWQRAYRERVRKDGPDSSVYDGPTQRAVCHMQRLTGQPIDGLLGPDVWAAVFTYTRPRYETKERPKLEGRDIWLAGARRSQKANSYTRQSWHYWRLYSSHNVTYANTPGAPPWYPGRPFSRHEQGWHVREVQQLLGIKPTGRFNVDTQRRVRGLQRLHRLPESGIVDVATAVLIDPGPWPELDDSEV